MRFGLFIPQGWRLDLVGIDPGEQWGVMRDLASYADDGGIWDSLWVYDHFHTVPMPTKEATHEAWSLMAAYAATTSRIKLGQMCTAMSYRNPVYLAKVAATCDLISGGRIQMGIGGGWYEHEWRAYGYGFPSAGVRLARLDEGVQIMGDAWREASSVSRASTIRWTGPSSSRDLCRRAVSRCGSPVVVRKSPCVSRRSTPSTPISRRSRSFAHKSQVLAAHCRDVGTDFGAIVRSANINVVVGSSEADVQDRLNGVRSRIRALTGDAAADAMLNSMSSPAAGSGTPEQIIEALQKLRDLGCDYIICYFPEAAYDRSGVEAFEKEIIPALS